MDKKLEKLFEDLEGTFDTRIPEDGHRERFLEKLKSPSNKVEVLHKPKTWLRLLAIAASVAVLFAVGFTMLKTDLSSKEQLTKISPEVVNTEFYFASLIEEQVKELQKKSTPETRRIVDDAMHQLQKLETNYNMLEKDLLSGGNSKMILSAMITNFQTRIDLLKEVMDTIENIKNLKQSNDENYTI